MDARLRSRHGARRDACVGLSSIPVHSRPSPRPWPACKTFRTSGWRACPRRFLLCALRAWAATVPANRWGCRFREIANRWLRFVRIVSCIATDIVAAVQRAPQAPTGLRAQPAHPTGEEISRKIKEMLALFAVRTASRRARFTVVLMHLYSRDAVRSPRTARNTPNVLMQGTGVRIPLLVPALSRRIFGRFDRALLSTGFLE